MEDEWRRIEANETIYPNWPDTHKIWRFVSASVYLMHYDLPQSVRQTLHRFVDVFRAAYPELSAGGDRVCKLFAEHDVFSREGHEAIVRGVLSDWGLDEVCTLKRWPLPAL